MEFTFFNISNCFIIYLFKILIFKIQKQLELKLIEVCKFILNEAYILKDEI